MEEEYVAKGSVQKRKCWIYRKILGKIFNVLTFLLTSTKGSYFLDWLIDWFIGPSQAEWS